MADSDLKFELGRKLHSRGQTIEATSSLQDAIKANPKNPEVYNYLGLLLFERNMYAQAKEQVLKAVALNPKYSEAYNHLCVISSEMGQYDEAIRFCYKALENVLYTTPERAYYNLAKVYEKKGDLVKEKECHQKALGFNKRFVLSLRELGQIQYEEKDYKNAQKNLFEASDVCKTAPKGSWQESCSETNYDLAMTYLRLKDQQKAKAAFQECVLNSQEDSPMAQKCKERMVLIK